MRLVDEVDAQILLLVVADGLGVLRLAWPLLALVVIPDAWAGLLFVLRVFEDCRDERLLGLALELAIIFG